MALMANGLYDFRMVSPTFVPYLGGGLGLPGSPSRRPIPRRGTGIDD